MDENKNDMSNVNEKNTIKDYSWIGIGLLFATSMSIAMDNVLVGALFGLAIGICFKKR